MRYEVRVYNLEELLPDNRMTYIPCSSQEEAKEKYANALQYEADDYHRVDLCAVEYTSYGEYVRTLASSESLDPKHIIWEDEYI